MEQDNKDKIIDDLEREAQKCVDLANSLVNKNDSNEPKIFKNKGEEIAATGKCEGEGAKSPNQYSATYPEEEAKKLLKEFTYTKDDAVNPPYNAFAQLGNSEKNSITQILESKFDQDIVEHIRKIDLIPDPVKEPCEESEQMCEVFSKGRETAKKVLDKCRYKNTYGYKSENCETELNFKLTIAEKEQIKERAKRYGFKNLSDYMRVVLLNAKIDVAQDNNVESLKTKYEDPTYGDLYYFMDKFIKDPSDLNYRRLVLLFDSVQTYKLNKPKE